MTFTRRFRLGKGAPELKSENNKRNNLQLKNNLLTMNIMFNSFSVNRKGSPRCLKKNDEDRLRLITALAEKKKNDEDRLRKTSENSSNVRKPFPSSSMALKAVLTICWVTVTLDPSSLATFTHKSNLDDRCHGSQHHIVKTRC